MTRFTPVRKSQPIIASRKSQIQDTSDNKFYNTVSSGPDRDDITEVEKLVKHPELLTNDEILSRDPALAAMIAKRRARLADIHRLKELNRKKRRDAIIKKNLKNRRTR